MTAAVSATVRNVENLVINLDASTTAAVAGGATANEFVFAATNFSGVKNYTVDVTRAITGVNDLLLDDAEDGSTVNISSDFSAAEITVETAGDDVSVNVAGKGTTASPVVLTLTAGTAPGDVTAVGAGNLSVQATTATGIVNATAESGLTINSDLALVVMGEAKAGDLTVSSSGAAVIIDVKASGNVSVTDSGAGSVKAVAGGTITLVESAANEFDATSVNLSATGTSTIVGGAVGAATLSGNGSKATFAATASPLVDVAIEGSQDVTLQVSATVIDAATDKLSVRDNSTGTFTLEVSGAGSVDLRGGSLIDRLEIDANQGGGGDTLSVLSGQSVVYTTSQTAHTLAVGQASSASTNSVTIVLDDESKVSGAVGLDTLTITQAKTVVIDASVDTTSAGTANPSTIDALTASGANSNVTVNAGVNGVKFDGANTVGTGTLTVTGSGAVELQTATLTATAFDASAVTGAVSGTGLELNNVNTVSTGSGADTLTFAAGAASSFTISTGAGNDVVTMPGQDYGTANKLSIALGDGTDTLILQNGTKLTAGTGGSISITGLENLTLNATSTNQTLQASVLNGATYAVKASAASASGTLTANVALADTALDFSKLVASEAVDSAVTGMSLVVDASANTSAITIAGATKMKNSIEGGAGADSLTGGALNDTFVYDLDSLLFSADTVGVAIDTVSGGAGNDDTLLVGGTGGTAFTIASTDVWTNITGIEEVTVTLGSTARSVTLGATAETAGIVRLGTTGTQTASTVTLSAAGYTGAITINGAATSTAITGGAGNDSLVGGAAVDTIVGGAGNDTISGGGENDNISGGAGDDSITLSSGTPLAATVAGGDGTDTLTITPGAALTIANTAAFTNFTGIETLRLNMTGTDALSVAFINGAQDAGIRTISAVGASTGTITLDATALTVGVTINANTASTAAGSTITGGSGSDTLNGGSKADSITGGAGVDIITGGDGNDSLIGGDGNDIYVFASSGAANDTDVITFVANDRLDFSNFLGSGYSVMIPGGANYTPSSSSSTAVTAFIATDNTAVNVAGKVVVWSAGSAAAAAVAPDATAILAEFGASTGSQAFFLTTGKAVVVAIDIDSTTAGSEAIAANIYFVDASLDGAEGVSAADIVLVGTIASHVNPAINLNELAPNGG